MGTVNDSSDVVTGYALVNGRRTVYIPVTKRADASTLDVVRRVKANLPQMQALIPEDIKIGFQFDQSVYVTNALRSLLTEGGLVAILTGLMVWLVLRDLPKALLVITNIPFSSHAAIARLLLA